MGTNSLDSERDPFFFSQTLLRDKKLNVQFTIHRTVAMCQNYCSLNYSKLQVNRSSFSVLEEAPLCCSLMQCDHLLNSDVVFYFHWV